MVTLGCARNEVDSEELAGRLSRRRVPAGRRPGRRRHRAGQHLRLRRGRPRRTRVDTLLEAADLKGAGRPAGGRRGRLPGRAVRRGAGRVAARGRRGARLRRLPRHRRPAALDRGRGDAPPAHPAGPAPAAADLAGRAADAAPVAGTGRRPRPTAPLDSTRPDGAAQAGHRLRPTLHLLRDPVASAARSSAAGPPTSSTRPGGWPPRACASCSWSARTPRRTARTSATSGSSRRCCPSWPPSTASSGSGSPTSSRPRPGPGWSRRSRPRRASRRTSTSPSSTPATPCCAGCAASATRRASSACSTRSASLAPEAGVRSNVIVGFPGETEDDLETLCDFLVAARLDVIGVFGYSDEDGTEAASYDDKLDEDEVRARTERVADLVEELTAAAGRGADRRGRRGARRGRHRRRGRRPRRRTRVRRSTAPRPWSAADARVGDLVARRRGRQRRRRPGGEPAVTDRRGRRAAAGRATGTCPTSLTTLRIVLVPFFGVALLHRRRRLDRLAA